MLRVECQKTIEGVHTSEVFHTLSNPDGLPHLMPRLRKAELKDQGEDSAVLTLCIAIGNMFGTVCFRGHISWTEPDEIIFRVKKPTPAEIYWNLSEVAEGTLVRVTAKLDLAPMLGPMVHFVPQQMVGEMIGKELDHALKEIDSRLKSTNAGTIQAVLHLA